MKIDHIEVRRIDYSVGVLRGVTSRPDLALAESARAEIELAIDHLRSTARFIERLQRQKTLGVRRRRPHPKKT